MTKRIKNETNVKNPKIQRLSDKKYRVYLGPFNDINSLQNSFNDINIFEFENIEIIKND
jgi:cell division protein FtsN